MKKKKLIIYLIVGIMIISSIGISFCVRINSHSKINEERKLEIWEENIPISNEQYESNISNIENYEEELDIITEEKKDIEISKELNSSNKITNTTNEEKINKENNQIIKDEINNTNKIKSVEGIKFEDEELYVPLILIVKLKDTYIDENSEIREIDRIEPKVVKGLELNIYPSEATLKNIEYTSSDEKIVKVDSEGNLTPVSYGNAIISVSVNDGEYTATYKAKVVAKTNVNIIISKQRNVLDPKMPNIICFNFSLSSSYTPKYSSDNRFITEYTFYRDNEKIEDIKKANDKAYYTETFVSGDYYVEYKVTDTSTGYITTGISQVTHIEI